METPPPSPSEPTEEFTPPYLAFRTLENQLERMRTEGIPSRIDRSYLGSWSGSAKSQFLSAARSLGFIDGNGHPTQVLIDLVQKPEERQRIMGDIVRDRYSAVIALGTNATQQQLEEVFRGYGSLSGSTIRKAIAFYLHAAQFSDIPTSPHFKVTRSPANGGGSTPRRRTNKSKGGGGGGGGKDEALDRPPASDAKSRYIDLLLKKAEEEMDDALLDRIERVIGVEDAAGKSGGSEEEE